MPGRSQDVDIRLAEIDRRLRELQADLVPGRTPRETPTALTRPPASEQSRAEESRVEEAPAEERPAEAPRPAAQPPPADRPPPSPATSPSLPDTTSPTSPPSSPAPEPSHHGRSGPLADALASARRRRDANRPPPEPAAEAPPPRSERRAVPPHPDAPRAPRPGLDALVELQMSLLAATRGLLDGYERAALSASEHSPLRVALSVGPFAHTDALHAFERALASIPGVTDVAVRGYEGPDRAILEVQLDQASREPST